MKISDLKASFVIEADTYITLPPHVAALCRYLISEDHDQLDDHGSLTVDSQRYQAIAAAGYVLATDSCRDDLVSQFKGAVKQLSGRKFFSGSRTPRLEVDSVALLGIALGARAAGIPQDGTEWIDNLMGLASETLRGDGWQCDLIEVGRRAINSDYDISIRDVRLRCAFSEAPTQEELQEAWGEMIARVGDSDPVQIAVNRAVFDRCAASLATHSIGSSGVAALVSILEGLTQSMSHWTYETRTRVKNVEPQRWEIDHEYHVQNLLWTVLRPVFVDLVDEQYLPKVGHKTPRYDLGVPSLRTIIESSSCVVLVQLSAAGSRKRLQLIDHFTSVTTLATRHWLFSFGTSVVKQKNTKPSRPVSKDWGVSKRLSFCLAPPVWIGPQGRTRISRWRVVNSSVFLSPGP